MVGIWLPRFPIPICAWAAGAEAPGRCYGVCWGCAAGSLGTWLPPSHSSQPPSGAWAGAGAVLGQNRGTLARIDMLNAKALPACRESVWHCTLGTVPSLASGASPGWWLREAGAWHRTGGLVRLMGWRGAAERRGPQRVGRSALRLWAAISAMPGISLAWLHVPLLSLQHGRNAMRDPLMQRRGQAAWGEAGQGDAAHPQPLPGSGVRGCRAHQGAAVFLIPPMFWPPWWRAVRWARRGCRVGWEGVEAA